MAQLQNDHAFMNGSKCATHMNCQSGFCKDGVCHKPEAFTPCGGLAACPTNYYCHQTNLHCLPNNYKPPSKCLRTPNCPWGQYCNNGKCTDRRGKGKACDVHTHCSYDTACHNKKCTIKCLSKDDCGDGEDCIPAPSPKGIKVCVKKPPLADSKPARVHPPKKPSSVQQQPPVQQPPVQQPPAQQPKPTQHHQNQTRSIWSLEGMKRFLVGNYKIIGGVAIVSILLILIIWLISRKLKRSKSKRSSLTNDANLPPMTANPIYTTTPTAPEDYSGAAPQPIVPIAPPSYEEVVRIGAASSSASLHSEDLKGGQTSPISPYDKS